MLHPGIQQEDRPGALCVRGRNPHRIDRPVRAHQDRQVHVADQRIEPRTVSVEETLHLSQDPFQADDVPRGEFLGFLAGRGVPFVDGRYQGARAAYSVAQRNARVEIEACFDIPAEGFGVDVCFEGGVLLEGFQVLGKAGDVLIGLAGRRIGLAFGQDQSSLVEIVRDGQPHSILDDAVFSEQEDFCVVELFAESHISSCRPNRWGW